MNVYDQAHQLASAIKGSEEFKQYDRLKKQIESNDDLNRAVRDFMSRQLELQTSQMMGQEPDADTIQQMQQLSAALMADPTAAEYMQCQMRFSMMMADVYKILGEVSDMGIDPSMFGGNRE